jgi:hypothetical protein
MQPIAQAGFSNYFPITERTLRRNCMNTPDTMHQRLQAFLRRFDALAKAVGPFDAPANQTTQEVIGLLQLSGGQCGVAAGIFDMAENIAHTLTSKVHSHAVKGHNLANPHRRGRMVVVPGFGDEEFQFPNVDSLVSGALKRLGGGDDRKLQPDRSRKNQPGSSEDPLLLVLGVTRLDEIMRMPQDASTSNHHQSKTPTKDLLHGHTTEPQVCFLRDAERLVEQTPMSDEGVRVVEFVVQSHGSLPDALLEAGEVFLGRAEQILAAAEAMCRDEKPPSGSTVAIPKEEERRTACCA